MASSIPFQDLNLPPYPTSPSSLTQSPIIVPNMEPNLETFHEEMPLIIPDPQFSRNIDSAPLAQEPNQDRRVFDRRSSQLVRMNNLTLEEQRVLREDVRRTKMLFDSLRISVSSEQDELFREGNEEGRSRIRGDLKAYSTMKNKGLWLNRDKRVVGSIPGIEIGDVFLSRIELQVLGLHGQIQAGIDFVPANQSTDGEPVATSIVVNEGFKDDQDLGKEIIYCGQGNQISNQRMEGGNLALQTSYDREVEIRVIRGFKYEGSETAKIYVYDGLYIITEIWLDIGRSGYQVYKFQLERVENQARTGTRAFRFTEDVKNAPQSILSPDISMGKERLFPISLFNDVDNDCGPMHYKYISTTIFPSTVNLFLDEDFGCGCVDGCFDNCSCCWNNGGNFPYDFRGVLIRGKPVIYECGQGCMCPPTCRNRASQNGLTKQFQVFKSGDTDSWGVRSLDLIKSGHFVCEFAGEVVTRAQAREMSINRDLLIDGKLFGDKWKEWGDLSRAVDDYVIPTYPPSQPLDFMIDLSKFRNLASYMRHENNELVANVMVQKVLYSHHNIFYPHLMLFALENIPPCRELILDYKDV
ncbi:histone-lysine N-methyltransferase family member SUVH9-like [Impatiens glandulifera]|uniref:histone-lysine N-methyltransferase family member SUVH9-like n=1 Tax=Impatiens glandulifera TaxID=253017 RepID=UPI001FB197F1|nr:histone-lysine N-methyltransferase family member SUVH9-like [Impatiens glandulifera]